MYETPPYNFFATIQLCMHPPPLLFCNIEGNIFSRHNFAQEIKIIFFLANDREKKNTIRKKCQLSAQSTISGKKRHTIYIIVYNLWFLNLTTNYSTTSVKFNTHSSTIGSSHRKLSVIIFQKIFACAFSLLRKKTFP